MFIGKCLSFYPITWAVSECEHCAFITMALKEGLNSMPNESQKQSENSANAVNSTNHKQWTWIQMAYSKNWRTAKQMPCLHKSDPVMLQQLSLWKTNSYWVPWTLSIHAYTLHMCLCMKWHGAWLYGVHRLAPRRQQFHVEPAMPEL